MKVPPVKFLLRMPADLKEVIEALTAWDKISPIPQKISAVSKTNLNSSQNEMILQLICNGMLSMAGVLREAMEEMEDDLSTLDAALENRVGDEFVFKMAPKLLAASGNVAAFNRDDDDGDTDEMFNLLFQYLREIGADRLTPDTMKIPYSWLEKEQALARKRLKMVKTALDWIDERFSEIREDAPGAPQSKPNIRLIKPAPDTPPN